MGIENRDSLSPEELDRRHLLHPFTSVQEHSDAGPHVITEGRGIRIRDRQGREYIDAMAGLWCVNVGYGRPEIVRAITEQSQKLSYYHSFMASGNEPSAHLAERLAAMAPGALNRVFFCNSGSEANDTHVKIVWLYNNLRGKPEKKKIISRHGAYHGVTVAAASMTGLPAVHAAFNLPLDGFIHVGKPHYPREAPEGMSERAFSDFLANELDERIQAEGPATVAAFIAEPVMGAAGVIPPPEGYFEAVVPVLRKHDVLFIADEVITGFGRLGTMFGSDHFGLEPDLMTLAKGLTSGYVPMAACLVSEKIWDVLRQGSAEVRQFSHGFTYSGHPLAAAAALANLDIIENEGLVANAAKVGAYLQTRLAETFADHPLVGEIRGLGLVAGIELMADKKAKTPFDAELTIGRRLHTKLLEEGLVCRPVGNSLVFSPSLIVTQSDIDEIVDRFSRGLDRLTDELVKDGTWKGA